MKTAFRFASYEPEAGHRVLVDNNLTAHEALKVIQVACLQWKVTIVATTAAVATPAWLRTCCHMLNHSATVYDSGCLRRQQIHCRVLNLIMPFLMSIWDQTKVPKQRAQAALFCLLHMAPARMLGRTRLGIFSCASASLLSGAQYGFRVVWHPSAMSLGMASVLLAPWTCRASRGSPRGLAVARTQTGLGASIQEVLIRGLSPRVLLGLRCNVEGRTQR